MPAYTDPVIRFWRYVNKTPGEGCWLWLGAGDGYGYGAFGVSRPRRVVKAHRYAWELEHGPVPHGLCVLHNCPGGDNTRCVRPSHMFLGTRDTNNKDKVQKGGQVRGETHGLAILTQTAVDEIKMKYASDRYLQRELAAEYGVSRQAIGLIIQGKRWNK